jgi:hypothetical protein
MRFVFITEGIAILALLIALVSGAEVAKKAAPAEKKIYTKTVLSDSVRVAVVESLLVVRHDTVKVAVTLKDTTKAVRADTTHGYRVDTLKIKRAK